MQIALLAVVLLLLFRDQGGAMPRTSSGGAARRPPPPPPPSAADQFMNSLGALGAAAGAFAKSYGGGTASSSQYQGPGAGDSLMTPSFGDSTPRYYDSLAGTAGVQDYDAQAGTVYGIAGIDY